MSSPANPQALGAIMDHLKGRENPFESLARPQRLDDRFLDQHVPELLAEERQTLQAILARYRVDMYRSLTDLQNTRVVTVLGDRGAGKTHLLRSLEQGADGQAQLIVKPQFYDRARSFEEYALDQLVARLMQPNEAYEGRPIDALARVVTRRLLHQTLLALTPTDWLQVLPPGRIRRWFLPWAWGGELRHSGRRLAAAVLETKSHIPLREVLRSHNLPPKVAYRLCTGHLNRFELGHTPLARMRRGLYSRLAYAELTGDFTFVEQFLTGGFVPQDVAGGPRFELAARLLDSLVECCSLVRLPVVIAFDNLERLFAGTTAQEGALARGFFGDLAHAVDSTRGLLILILAERGFFEASLLPHMDSFAQSRLTQGVPLQGQGPVSQVTLQPPSNAQLVALVKRRMQPLLATLPDRHDLPAAFPFDDQFILGEATASGLQGLRNSILRLRDEYSRRVYQRTPPPDPIDKKADTASSPIRIGALWKDQLAKAARLLQDGAGSQRAGFHAGLGRLLMQAMPLKCGGWQLIDVQPAVAVGDHPTYGQVSILHWGQDGTEERRRVAVGFLLAGGRGMAADLKAKFEVFRKRSLDVDRLIVLWLTDKDETDLADQLPGVTGETWKQSARDRAELRRVTDTELAMLLAVPELTNVLAEEGPISPEALRSFIQTEVRPIQDLIAPASVEPVQRSLVHAD